MNDESDAKREQTVFTDYSVARPFAGAANHGTRSNGASGPGAHKNGAPQLTPADAWPFAMALVRRWHWLLGTGILFAALAVTAGLLFWKSTYTVTAQLIRHQAPAINEVLGEQQMSMGTFAALLRAPALVKHIAAQTKAPFTLDWFNKHSRVLSENESDVLTIEVSANSPEASVELANLYAEEAVRFTRQLQSQNAAEVDAFLSQQLTPVEAQITALNKPRAGTRPAVRSSSALFEKLIAARAELADLQALYTDKHPKVREQQAKIAAIESQIAQVVPGNIVTNASGMLSPADAAAMDPVAAANESLFLNGKLQSLESTRLTLEGRKQAALTLQANPPGECQLLAPALLKNVEAHKRTLKVGLLGFLAGMLGIIFAAALVLVGELFDDRLKTKEDVQRVTDLPVITTAGDLEQMNEAEQRNWAFRAWTSLQGRLSPSPNHGLVCGITSSAEGEGRSTWVRLLAEAASHRGFRVLTIVAEPSTRNGHSKKKNGATAPQLNGQDAHRKPELANGADVTNGELPLETGLPQSLAANVLSSPTEVTQKLIGPNPQPVVQIPLPGWVWNLERRKQWQAALRHWSKIDNIAIIVELPPASMPETVLLAENLPNLVWLTDSGKAAARATREQLETLRHAKCKLAGAVLNHAPTWPLGKYLARWIGCSVLLLGLSLSGHAQDAVVEPTNAPAVPLNTNYSFSVIAPAQRAAWQKRLTLGPGDVLTLGLYGEPTLQRTEVAIGPDGRISFSEAQDILASGLTVDELRSKLDEELGKYRRAPQTFVTPVAFRSKRYYVLGKVVQKGVYILDRPITVLEAVARARGFENGLVDRNIIDTADFSRSFLMRGGKRYSLNFENLFANGDLSQNIPIEPGDYLFFPTTDVKEVYVLGEVRLPGAVPYRPDLTVVGAISARAGFTDRAYKSHVLVVRGSLNHPERFVVDVPDILKAKGNDFKLQPKDIVFVNYRPLIKVEELTDLAFTAFVQAMVSGWVGEALIKPYHQ